MGKKGGNAMSKNVGKIIINRQISQQTLILMSAEMVIGGNQSLGW